MPIPNEYREIIRALTEKTEQGDLSWTNDSLHISVKIDLSKFSLWAGTDERSDEAFVAFGLFNNVNKVIDSWFVDESDPDYMEVHRLFKAAQRQANGVPTLLKTLADRISNIKKGEVH
jgi:hypothetical protein